MPFCRFCGSRISTDSAFCGICGKPLTPTALIASNTLQSDALARASAEETLLISSEVEVNNAQTGRNADPATLTTAPEATTQRERKLAGEITPLPPVIQLPPTGHVPAVVGTPQIGHVPTLASVPQVNNVTATQGVPQAPGSSATSNPGQPGSSLRASHASNAQGAGQPGTTHMTHPGGHTPGQASASVKRPRMHASRRWGGLRRAVHQGVTHGTATNSAGVGISAVATGGIVKAIAAVVIITAVAVGAVKAAPQLFHRVQNAQPALTSTQPMPPTLTSCPAEGTARAAVKAYLAPGHHQTLVFSTNSGLERYDPTSGHTTTILRNSSILDAKLSADGAWILLLDQVSGQPAIQMIRLDGQGLQTLHCAPAGQSLFNLTWSADQQNLAFDEGVDFMQNNTSAGAANTDLLQMKTGKLQTLLLQPPYTATQAGPGDFGYLPAYWTDDTHLSLEDYIRCCVGDTPPITLYQLDLSLGNDQHPNNLTTTTVIHDGALQGIALSPDHRKLFLSDCRCGFGSSTGPSPITEQPTTGGQASTIYTDSNDAIVNIASIDANNLLLYIANFQGDQSQSGLWKLNLVTHQKVRLMPLSFQFLNGGNYLIFNDTTFSPWDNVSRDGSMYVTNLQASDAPTAHVVVTNTLFLGSLQGNRPPTQIYTNAVTHRTGDVTALSSPAVSVVGWTTI